MMVSRSFCAGARKVASRGLSTVVYNIRRTENSIVISGRLGTIRRAAKQFNTGAIFAEVGGECCYVVITCNAVAGSAWGVSAGGTGSGCNWSLGHVVAFQRCESQGSWCADRKRLLTVMVFRWLLSSTFVCTGLT